MALSTSTFWIGNLVIALMTPILLDSVLRTSGTFYLLAAVHLIAFIFVLTTLPETKVTSKGSRGCAFMEFKHFYHSHEK